MVVHYRRHSFHHASFNPSFTLFILETDCLHHYLETGGFGCRGTMSILGGKQSNHAGELSQPGDVRRTVSFQTKSSGSISGCSSSMSLSDMVEPPDWEELSSRLVTDRDPLSYPSNDLEVSIVPRRIRTIKHVLPEEDLCKVPLHVRECVRCHTSDWIAVDYHYRSFSGSCVTRERLNERHALMQTIPRQDYEVDIDPHLVSTPSEELTLQGYSQSQTPSGRQSISSISSVSSCNDTLTPRGSWASLDLRSSSSDPLLPDLLERRPPDQLDQINEQRRMEGRRGGLLGLYASYLDDDEAVERRVQADTPCQVIGHRILVKCLNLRLDLEVEPIFASIALYDAKERKKVSENFYFDLNSDGIKQMLSCHIPKCDVSTLSRNCVFDITHPTPDLFLVVRLEKVLQGDITECVEPYIKDDKNREKVKMSAVAACERLGKYRMPFAWTAIYLMNTINGSTSLEREHSLASERDSLSSSQSNSLDRKSSAGSLEQLRRQGAGGSLCRRGSLERRAMSYSTASNTDDLGHNLSSFKPITITVNNFFKQESDKLRDEDLYKFLLELKRPTALMKKLKNIPGILKLEISPCSEDIDNGLTPELAKLHPYADNTTRPCKEILPFPLAPLLVPHYQYRNLLYVYPKDLNFTSFTSRTGSARNIAVRIQLMCGEDQSKALPAIFGRSSCMEFSSEAYTTVTYHNKCPSFYDEIKVKLPANLGDHHHLLFTFYHISCQKKPVTAPEQEKTIETPVGYTWLPMCRSGKLTTGEYNLPVMQEPPPPNYSFIFPDVLLPGTKWIDNHKPIFTIALEPISSVNPMDSCIERFLMACEAVQEGVIPPRIGLSNMEAELRNSIIDLQNSGSEAMVKSLPVILDKLILFLVMPPSLNGQQLNIAQDVFSCLSQIFTKITNMNDGSMCDAHGRSPLLGSYIQYQCLIPRPAKPHSTNSYTHPRSPSHHSHLATSALQIARNKSGEMFEWCSNFSSSMTSSSLNTDSSCKALHEELSLQWVVASGTTRDLAMQNSWTLFELMIKSMVEQLWWNGTLEAPRKSRFSDQLMDDITTLVSNITSEIISRYGKNIKLTQSLNNSLAFFLFDLLSIVDRGFVFGLIRTYYKQMSAKIASLPDATPLIHFKIAFLRIVCSHEHYISLNLPCGTPYTGPVTPSSPSPSTHSSHSAHSHSSNVSTQLSNSDRGCFTELSSEFRHQHFLVGLLLSELSSVLDIQSPVLQGKAVCAVLSLLTSHDSDGRFSQPDVKARVAALYIPLLAIVMDSYPQLYTGFLQGKDRVQLGEDNLESLAYCGLPSPTDSFEYKKTLRAHLNSETTRNLLMCFLWVLKSVDKAAVTRWCGELQPNRLHTLLQVLSLCYACFEYKGKKEIQRCAQQNVRKTSDIKSRLEDVILGQGSARSELMMRRKGCHSTMSGEKRERWRKEWVRGGSGGAGGNSPMVATHSPHPANTSTTSHPPPPLPPAHLEGALAADVSLTVLHTLETIVQVASSWESHHSLFGLVLRVLLLGLAKNQSTNVLQHMFATQRSLVFKFHWLVFDSETEQCGELCLVLLRHCGALCGAVRAHAAATLYLLMRQNYEIGNNFARVKMQVTMSLSSLVGTSATFSEDSLRRALKTILLYAEQDTDLQDTSFPEQVKDLVFNLHMILSDTVKMKEFQEDPEMLLDLMHRIAKGYQNSPDLRLTWLNNMAQKHMERSNHTEAGMCLVHSAALVAEYLVLLGVGSSAALGGGAVSLQKVTPNALYESAVSDDVMTPRNEGICLGKDFTEQGLQGLLEHAANCCHTAGMYEAMNEVYKVLLPIAEANRDYKKLANIHGKLNEAYTRIEQLSGKRVQFGTYFRVGFYGSKFGDLNGEEFIYKEPTLTKLPEIFSRLENFYGQRFGTENIVIIKDSNTVDAGMLDPDKAYIQITYVEPYFEPYELRYRLTHFEKNFNIKRFIYATPFTTSGKPHGDLIEQCKRKTVLTTAHHFPYVKTRIQVVQRTQVVLSPIEVAIEDIQKKINELAAATNQDPPDTKMLQMVVQGCIGTTVNQGPMEMALVFLSGVADGTQPPTKLANKLRLCFKDFSKKCSDALKKNKNHIGNDQKEYQRELERNYQRFTERLAPLIQSTPGHVAQLSNGAMKQDWRYHS